MHYQVYIPGAADVAFELTKVGLADLVPNAECLTEPNGPDGQGGAIFSWWTNGPKSRRMHFSAKEQDWFASPDKRYWVGLWRDERPLPDDLVIGGDRGVRVRLGDANTWLVPSVDLAEREMIVEPDGRRTFATPRRFEHLRSQQMQWREWVERQGDVFDLTDALFWQWFDVCVSALKLNYRLTPEVVGALRLLSTGNIIDVMNAVCGPLIKRA
jgi:hypothetical protein